MLELIKVAHREIADYGFLLCGFKLGNLWVFKHFFDDKETPDSRIFLMKDLATVEEAERQGAKLYQGDYGRLVLDNGFGMDLL